MVKVFAPVNIAWIKYMGKENGNPTNSSLSMTLGEIGTITRIKKISDSEGLEFSWSQEGYVPPQTGRDKAEYFLKNEKVWRDGFLDLGFNFIAPSGHFEISTFNNVPAGTGIATSASGFAALTLAWIGVLMGPQIARTMLVMLLTSSGMFVASTTLLPSSFAMYAVTAASAAVLEQRFILGKLPCRRSFWDSPNTGLFSNQSFLTWLC